MTAAICNAVGTDSSQLRISIDTYTALDCNVTIVRAICEGYVVCVITVCQQARYNQRRCYFGIVVDCDVTLDKNVYNNIESLSVIVREMRFSNIDEDGVLCSRDLFEAFCRGDNITKAQALQLFPTRDEFAVVYRFLRAAGGFKHNIETLFYRLNFKSLTYGKLRVILECMNELSLIEIYEGMSSTNIKLCEVQGKVNLDDSLIISKLKEVSENA